MVYQWSIKCILIKSLLQILVMIANNIRLLKMEYDYITDNKILIGSAEIIGEKIAFL